MTSSRVSVSEIVAVKTRVAVERALEREEAGEVAPRRLVAARLQPRGHLLAGGVELVAGLDRQPLEHLHPGELRASGHAHVRSLQQKLHEVVDHRQDLGVGGIGLLDEHQRLELGVAVDADLVRLLLDQRRLARGQVGEVLVAARARARRRRRRSPRPSSPSRSPRSARRSRSASARRPSRRRGPGGWRRRPRFPTVAAERPSRSRQTSPPASGSTAALRAIRPATPTPLPASTKRPAPDGVEGPAGHQALEAVDEVGGVAVDLGVELGHDPCRAPRRARRASRRRTGPCRSPRRPRSGRSAAPWSCERPERPAPTVRSGVTTFAAAVKESA